uniref:F-box domain-containing protein n=1 Tax=Kalanchoe fedtschenkoi TaxID=63787 RepID=A0A7N0TK80_KALFE
MEYFTDDMLIPILLKLPAKSLVKFKSVSKSWEEIISSSAFIYHHYKTFSDAAADGHTSFLVIHDTFVPRLDYYFTRLSVSFADGQLISKTDETFHLPFMKTDLEAPPVDTPLIYAAGFGIYCIFIFHARTVALWNPATRESKLLPLSPFHSPSKRDTYVYGFAHVEYDDGGFFSYKVGLLRVRFLNLAYRVSIELYSSRENSWKFFKKCFCLIRIGNQATGKNWVYSGTNLNGKFHLFTWVNIKDPHIVTFDMSKEEVGRLEIPAFIRHDSSYDLTSSLLTKFDEKFLCLLIYRKNNENVIYLDVWIMLQYGVTESWTKISTAGPISIPEYVDVLGISKSVGGLVIHGLDHGDGLFFCRYDSSNVQILLPIPSDVYECALFVECRDSHVSFGGTSDQRIGANIAHSSRTPAHNSRISTVCSDAAL